MRGKLMLCIMDMKSHQLMGKYAVTNWICWVLPPTYEKGPGRPKKLRRELYEHTNRTRLRREKTCYKCKKCGAIRHNVRTWLVPLLVVVEEETNNDEQETNTVEPEANNTKLVANTIEHMSNTVKSMANCCWTLGQHYCTYCQQCSITSSCK